MDSSLLLQQFQYAIPVGIVLICAILVFVFGFKNAEQPPFAQLSAVSDVDRKQVNKKKSKIKEKRGSGNQVNNEKGSPIKKSSPLKNEGGKKVSSTFKNDDVEGKLKERKQDDNGNDNKQQGGNKKDKEKNQLTLKVGKENKAEQVKNKKNLKNLILEKPVDFDEGGWEQAYSKKDKRKKKEEDTPKKTKKTKKIDLINLINESLVKNKDQEKGEIKDKVAKETENKELKEKQKDVILESTTVYIEPEVTKVELDDENKKAEKMEKPEKEEKKSNSKPKKVKKTDKENVTTEIPLEKKSSEKVEKVNPKKVEQVEKTEPVIEQPKIDKVPEKPIATFDESGDVWTEAKAPKKSKKKARKDN